MIKIIDRYIFRELIEPFLFGLGSFTAILASSMILFELVRAIVLRGMPLMMALQIFIYRLPAIVVYIFPMATLLGALLAFGRLSGDSEVVAFRGSGISLYRLIIPVLFLGLLVSCTNLLFSEVVVPQANFAAKNLLLAASATHTPKIQKNIFVPEIEHGILRRIFYAGTIQGEDMHDVIVQEFTDRKLSQIVTAERARWQKGQNKWVFYDGIIYLIAENGEYKHLVRFKEQALAIKYSPADFLMEDKSPDDMTIRQLGEYVSKQERKGLDVTDLKIQLNMKMSIPFASLVFALLGAPLGLSPRRASSSIGLGLSILVIFFYYILTFICMAGSEAKFLAPVLAAWLPNFITAGVGWYILSKAATK